MIRDEHLKTFTKLHRDVENSSMLVKSHPLRNTLIHSFDIDLIHACVGLEKDI